MIVRRSAAALVALGALAACDAPDPVAPPGARATSLAPSLKREALTGGDEVLASARSNAAEPQHLDRGRFNISLKYVTPVTDAQRAVFDAAAARWERTIIKDVPSVEGILPSAFAGFPPASSTVVDDIVIEVALTEIDGPGSNGRNVLGQAGPRFIRFVDGLPVSGVMFFDVYDLGFLDQFGLFDEVIVHEMGHVLGIGTLWNLGAPFPVRSLRQGTASEYHFVGQYANVHWNAEGGTGLLPIANVGAAGSIGSHWRESVMRNELMTPSINLGENPLSRITAASLRDLGYGVGIVGERYALPKGAPGEFPGDAAPAVVNIADGEDLLRPVGVVMPKP